MSAPNLGIAVGALSFDAFDRVRTSPGTQGLDGIFIPGDQADEPFTGSVTPMSAKELKKLPDGERTSAGIRIITTANLRTGDREQKIQADRVRFKGVLYKVVTEADWGTFGFGDYGAAKVEP